MRKVKLTALALASAAVIYLFAGCTAEMRSDDPISGYDKTTVVASDEDGDFRVMEKTFGYDGNNVELIRVENGTGSAYDIRIIASFDVPWRDKPMKIPKFVYGFPAHYSGYVLIQPGTGYDGCELKIGLSLAEEESPLKYLEFETDLDLLVTLGYNIESELFPDSDIVYCLETSLLNESGRDIYLEYSYIAFDESGEIFAVFDKSVTTGEGEKRSLSFRQGIPYEGTIDGYRLPDNLRGELHGVVAVDSAEYYESFN